jgi:hypothetical protein
MPGFTHLQSAQPVTFGHHLMAYVEMFGRDRGAFATPAPASTNVPSGAGALAGTSFPIDRHMTAGALGFDGPTRNSLDSVSDRDSLLEFMAAASICAVHLSRLAEEIIIWMSAPSLRAPADRWTTGSSMMPQKRNPDAAELVRGKAGRVVGSLVALITTMKGLPLTYSKDMQEDKEQVFDAADTLEICLAAMTGMIADIEPVPERMRAAAGRASPRPPTSRTGWCGPWGFPSGTRITSRAASWPRPSDGVAAWRTFRWTPCRRSSRGSLRRSTRCSASRTRSAPARASAARRPSGWRRPRPGGGRGFEGARRRGEPRRGSHLSPGGRGRAAQPTG